MKNTSIELYDNRKWNDLGANDKFKLSLAASLIVSSIIMGFISFIWLQEVPTSVIGTMGLFFSESLALLGISSYFYNQLYQFKAEVNKKLDEIGKDEHDKNTEEEVV